MMCIRVHTKAGISRKPAGFPRKASAVFPLVEIMFAGLAQSSRFTRVIDGQVTDPKRWFERDGYTSGVEPARCVVGKVFFVHRVSEMHTLVSAGFPSPPAVDKEKIHPRAELAVVVTSLNK